MQEIVRTDDLVLLSYLESLLRQAGIEPVLLDRAISGMPGAIGIVPQRVMVDEEQWQAACNVLIEAVLGQWIVRDGSR